MNARKSAIFALAWKVKPLAFISLLHPLREFWAKKYFTDPLKPNTIHRFGDLILSVKCTTVTVGYAKILSNISFFPISAMQAMTMDKLDENKPLLNTFKRDCNGIRTRSHLGRKRTLNHLGKLAKMIELCCEYLFKLYSILIILYLKINQHLLEISKFGMYLWIVYCSYLQYEELFNSAAISFC